MAVARAFWLGINPVIVRSTLSPPFHEPNLTGSAQVALVVDPYAPALHRYEFEGMKAYYTLLIFCPLCYLYMYLVQPVLIERTCV